ncbi:uncharacterized protein LOC144340862 isoform X2 [Macaca mulatta]
MPKIELYTVESWMALLDSDSCPKLRNGSECCLKGNMDEHDQGESKRMKEQGAYHGGCKRNFSPRTVVPDIESHYAGQTGLKLLDSSNPPICLNFPKCWNYRLRTNNMRSVFLSNLSQVELQVIRTLGCQSN